MSKLRKSILNTLQELGDNSGCHQLPERSLFIKNRQLPVCARCTGVMIGQISATLMGLIYKPISTLISIAMLFVMGLDWGLQEFKILESTNVRRFITGVLGGYGLFNLYLKSILKIIHFFRN